MALNRTLKQTTHKARPPVIQDHGKGSDFGNYTCKTELQAQSCSM